MNFTKEKEQKYWDELCKRVTKHLRDEDEKHICGSCTNKKCPKAGSETWDRIAHGPTTDCMRYYPPFRIWTCMFRPLHWLCDWISRL